MSTGSRINNYRDIVTDFHHIIKPRWSNDGVNIKTVNEQWIKAISEKYKDDKLTLYAHELLLSEVHIFYNHPSPEPIAYDQLALVMKGGGIKGLAYVGALEVLQDHYEFDWFSGTSAGAIAALLLGSGHNVKELNEILATKNFADFKDANFFQMLRNLILEKGLYKANTFVEWIDELLSQKLESNVAVRLQDLPKRTTVYASRKDKKALIFDSHEAASREQSASFAARCSMSIPYMFTPQSSEGMRVLDGGAQNNFPVDEILESKKDSNFIGLYLGEEIYKPKRKSLLLFDLISIFTESTDPEILRKYKDKIVVIDPSPISTMQFKLSSEEKEFLLEAGRLGAIKFLDKRSDFNKEDYDYNKRKKLLEEKRKIITKQKRGKRVWFKAKVYAVIILIFLSLCLLLSLIGSLLLSLISSI
ncbi:Patatin-like phospholipase [Salegentibacter holothuriorum]|uniref:Patatin-like phospholipase n=1 Tax=Salegentibacter holothuriorum TaxID=241145 RepID=A0A1T5BNS3_9FLAO|nr:patatin-like phospholipase family protein [Salegentibacter holothuriorum]SKB48868.1 Patatin-like phospholipase [Salegentibacter holothuriorum]